MHGHGLIQLESKMKKKIIIFLLIFNSIWIYAQSDFNIKNGYMGFTIKNYFCSIFFYENNQIEFLDDGNPDMYEVWNQTFKYTATGCKGLYEIKLDNGIKFTALVSKKYLVLYKSDFKEPFFVGGVSISRERTYPIHKIKASSFLTEKNIFYKVENLSNLNLDSPWVEGVNGNGIGETLTFTTNSPGIVFFSGYISAKNPSLYEKNSRIKKAKFKCVENGREFIFNFEDTAGGQQIDLSDLFQYNGKNSFTIIMEILDVYKGTRYQDTCVNSMFVGFSHIN